MKWILASVLCLLIVACSPAAPQAQETQEIIVNNGEMFSLQASVVQGTFATAPMQLYAYNGQIPGPRIRVKQGSTIVVNFTNNLPEPSTVHWHGLRLDNRFDGVPEMTQDPVQSGESYLYTLKFPDAGVFWYHPHVREDRQQDMGLYGNIVVEPEHSDGIREEFLFVDDVLLQKDGSLAPYGEDKPTHALMGRFGNIMLLNGKNNYTLNATQGETIRIAMTSAASVRPFNLSFGMPVILEGSDTSSYEHEVEVNSIVIGPAERYIIRIPFTKAGTYLIQNTNMWQTYDVGTITVRPSGTDADSALRTNIGVIEDIDNYRRYFNTTPDAELRLDIDFHHDAQEMHSISNIEWEDTMEDENAHTTPDDVTWKITNTETNLSNMNTSLKFPVNSVKKIRIINDNTSAHPMQHLMHLHGQRFLILNQDGVLNTNLAWKDTVLVPSGSTVDLLVDATNPGDWMFHCHIPEHMEAGMMTTVHVGEGSMKQH